ncbi:MAG: PhoU domain-containing protein [Xanthomonadales bacterium]|nr:PhoU domain-containing protein [Xanthomonadales bacterium]
MSHFEERMEADLKTIRNRLWKIGEDVDVALHSAKKVMILRDSELAYQTVLGDYPINRESRECDRYCHTFIARHLPGAGPLREMAATARVNVALERIGDYAVTISREALQVTSPITAQLTQSSDAMFDESISILSDARKSFRDGNAEMAIALMKVAKRVQNRMDGVYETLFAEDDRMDGASMMAIFVVFNLLKRIVDQAKNICDQTVYAVKGIAKIPKTYRILFLDQPGSGLAQLASAIGRKNYPESGFFMPATPGASDSVSVELQEFLVERGLPDEGLVTEQLEVSEHDLDDFTIIVSLRGKYSDYISKVPFHTSAFNWVLPEGADLTENYRVLLEEIQQLMTNMAGDDAS